MTTDCIVWSGCVDKDGYGKVSFRKAGVRKASVRVHRYVYAWINGPIPAGLQVLHSCDNPPCCNPDHLRLGTHDENMKDMQRRKRHSLARRTTCKNGHEFTPENTRLQRRAGHGVQRACRKCQASNSRLYQERKLAAATASAESPR